MRRFIPCLVALAACSGPGAAPALESRPTHSTATAAAPSPQPAAAAPDAGVEPSRFPHSVVDDPAAIKVVDEGGGRFEELVGSAGWQRIRREIRQQVAAIAARDSSAGESIRGHSHRLFHLGWLDEPTLELIGLTFRSERLPVDAADQCGDLRLIYRLAYSAEMKGETVYSRVPMTVLVELRGRTRDDSGCKSEAARWVSSTPLEGAELGRFLLDGALGGRLQPSEIQQVLVNVQTVRWPSAVRPDLGGHAEYLMLGFAPTPRGDGLQPLALENMPDVQRLRGKGALRKQLRAWIADNLDGIDEGTALLPAPFLAQRATSVTPRGLSRRANRPFRQIFEASDFEGLELSGRRRIGSPQALLRRLDDMSCVGCHQSRTIAGFHWLGVDGPETVVGNALQVSRSGPLLGDGRRRDAILLALLGDRPPDFARPFAERDDGDAGEIGAHCGLGDPGFASWGCAEGLVCAPHDAPKDDPVIGVCTSPGGGAIGEACELVPIVANADSHRDRAKGASIRPCASGVCNVDRTGFPGGMCTSSCASLGDDGACGVIAQLTPFNNCLARQEPFATCLAQHVSPAGLRACDEERLCRDDYICARTPAGQGGCIPPYFLFQLRVDGHP